MAKLSNTQIDQLGNRMRKGFLNEADLRFLDEYRRSFEEPFEFVILTIRQKLQLEPTGRPAKSTSSLFEKLRRESIRLSQVQDIAGCRIVVSDILEQDKIVALLTSIFTDVSIVDRRVKSSYNYRAVHGIIKIRNKLIEIQIRTALQHLWAELSEKYSDIYDPNIKYGGGSEEIRDLLLDISETIELIEKQEINLEENNKDSDSQETYVFQKKRMTEILTQAISGLEGKKKDK